MAWNPFLSERGCVKLAAKRLQPIARVSDRPNRLLRPTALLNEANSKEMTSCRSGTDDLRPRNR